MKNSRKIWILLLVFLGVVCLAASGILIFFQLQDDRHSRDTISDLQASMPDPDPSETPTEADNPSETEPSETSAPYTPACSTAHT